MKQFLLILVVSLATSNISAVKIRSISGFPEFLPHEQEEFDRIKTLIRDVYASFGYTPIETPAVERVETLKSKGIDGKEVYGLRRLNAEEGEDDSKEVALRFDQTVPLARYVAQHEDSLFFPFRRQAIGKVWRGEKAASGRFREFYQCDVDIIGRGELSCLYDAEPPAIINQVFEKMKIGDFIIRINNRKILQGLFSQWGLKEEARIRDGIKIIDNIEKASEKVTQSSLHHLGIDPVHVNEMQHLFAFRGSNEELLAYLDSIAKDEKFRLGLKELREVYIHTQSLGVPAHRLKIDLKIARGLDYYTGTVYETLLVDHPELGSICSGGRYDNLVESYSNAESFPGVGISIGLTRLFSSLLEHKLLPFEHKNKTVLVTVQDPACLSHYQGIADTLRKEGIITEMLYDDKKLSKQLSFASRKGISFCVIANADELKGSVVQVKNMMDGSQQVVGVQDLVKFFKKQ